MDKGKRVDANRWYPNPSLGLEIWGPLVPANDVKEGLYALSGIQMATGLLLWWIPGRMKRNSIAESRFGLPPSPATVWRNRLLNVTGIFSGTYLVYMSVLELVRLQLSRDPWVEDAKAARRRAEAVHGKNKVSWWFGPRGYRAVDYTEWKRRVDEQLESAPKKTLSSEPQEQQSQVQQHKWTVVKDVHSELKEANRKRANEILKHEIDRLEDVPSLIEQRHDEEALLHKSGAVEEADDDEDEHEEWIQLEAWKVLRKEIEVHMRLFPHTWILDEQDQPVKQEKELVIVVLSIGEDPHQPPRNN